MTILPLSKTCVHCDNEFPATAEYFHRDKKREGGLYPRCKVCKYIATRNLTTAQRFGQSVNKTSDCWLWTDRLKDNGYATFTWKGVGHYVHRYSYGLHYGKFDTTLQVLHTCDVRNCVNPEHLFLGTIADNMADKVAKGRQRRGVAHLMAKLTEEDVTKIRHAYAEKRYSQSQLGKQFGVTQTCIGAIVRRKTWSHIM